MDRHILQGHWDRLSGFSREFIGEVIGSERLFRSGLRQRVIGRLETEYDLDRDAAVQKVRDSEKNA